MLARAFAQLPLFENGRAIAKDETARLLAESAQSATSSGARRAVLLHDANPLRFALRFFALLDAGHVPVVLPPDVGASAIERLQPRADDALSAAGDGAAYGCSTSGTQGEPKLCFLGVEGARANARAHADSLGIGPRHTLLQSLPVHHAFGIVAYLFTALELGCALDFLPSLATFRGLARRSALEGGVLHASPAHVRFLLREARDAPPGLALVSVGAGHCDPGDLARLRARLPAADLFVTYGLTEAGPRVTTGRVEDEPRRGYVGRAIAGVELAVRVESGERRATGRGQLCVRSPSLKRNAAAEELTEDGQFFLTRDTVDLSPEGDVFFLTRGDDLIKSGGVSVYPLEIEEVARRHPDVIDALVLKRTDPLYEEVFDLVVESAAASLELLPFLQEHLPTPTSWPRRVLVLPSLPRSALGKIDRRAVAVIAGITGDDGP